MALELAHENIWFDKWRVDDAEREFYEKKYLPAVGFPCIRSSYTSRPIGVACKIREECEVEVYGQDVTEDISEEAHSPQEKTEKGGSGLGSLANQIAKARQEIQNSLASGGRGGGAPAGGASADVLNRITKLEGDNSFLTKRVSALEQTIINLTKQLEALQCTNKTTTAPVSQKKPEPKKEEEEEEDDDIDLFGSDSEEEDEEAARVREERLKAYADKKSKKPGPIAKSSVLLDCKPWDDETDMKAMENEVRKIEMDGLVWGAAKLVPLAFGIQKLSILCTVEDEKVSIDDLSETIQEIEDFVQSVDIAAFNKC